MLRNKKYTTLVAIAALTAGSHDVSAVRVKSDAQWHLAMIPDDFEQNNFISAPGRSLGFDPFGDFANFGSGFGGGFDDFPAMPNFGNMMKRAEQEGLANGNGQSYSSSQSSSYSSEMGADGKKHEKSSKQGQQTVCKDGQCKVVTCKNGNCQEKIESGKEASSDSKAQFESKLGGNQQSMSNAEQEMKDSFRQMGQRMRQMEQGFENMERHMADTFKDLPNKMHDIAANGGDEQSQTLSSSFEEHMGKDGKMHKKESKQGSELNCENGKCTKVVCKNGVCQQKTFQEVANQDPEDNEKRNMSPHPMVDMEKQEQNEKEGQSISKEQFKKIFEKLKEHMKTHGGDKEVIIKMDKPKKVEKPVENTPPPPPAFAPKN